MARTILSDLPTQVENIRKAGESLLDALGAVRGRQAKAQITIDRLQEEIVRLHRELTIEIAMTKEMSEMTDPRTGKPNKDWTELLTEDRIAKHPKFAEMAEKLRDAQTELFEAQNAVSDLADRLGEHRTQSRLLAALVYHMTGEMEE